MKNVCELVRAECCMKLKVNNNNNNKKDRQKIFPVKFRLNGYYSDANEAWGSRSKSSSR